MHTHKLIKRRLCRTLTFLVLSTSLTFSINSETLTTASQTQLHILNVEAFKLEDWEEVQFNGLTHYAVNDKQKPYSLKAESKHSASGLVLKKKVDLTKTPYINCRWRLEKGLPELPETTKHGDDYAARVYLIYSGGWLFWKTKALNYVWSSRLVKGQSWPNAYAPDNAQMIAVRDNSDKAGVWYSEKRHVQRDFESWLGEEVSQIEGIAIMTDTDDSRSRSVFHYGDIYFSEK